MDASPRDLERQAFEDHRLVEWVEYPNWGYYRFRRPDSSAYFVEAFATACDDVIVSGDIDTITFSRFGDSPAPRDKLAWMGRCQDFDHYVYEKARIGSGSRATKWDVDVFFDRAFNALTEAYRDQGSTIPGGGPTPRAITQLGSLKARYPIDAVHAELELQDDLDTLRDACMQGLVGLSWGEVPSPAVAYAHASLERLCALLEAEGPPQLGERRGARL